MLIPAARLLVASASGLHGAPSVDAFVRPPREVNGADLVIDHTRTLSIPAAATAVERAASRLRQAAAPAARGAERSTGSEGGATDPRVDLVWSRARRRARRAGAAPGPRDSTHLLFPSAHRRTTCSRMEGARLARHDVQLRTASTAIGPVTSSAPACERTVPRCGLIPSVVWGALRPREKLPR